ncbi:MAG: tRNA preQ1(34) S-adenosylmethionine ribosyltransferase-isomerase QueA [Nitrospiraceae bacterium]
MLLSEFDVPFDPLLIASQPVEPRHDARLLVLRRGECGYGSKERSDLTHCQVSALPALLRAGDLVVANDTKVLPARLHGRKLETGGRVELLYVRPIGPSRWEVLLKGRVRVGQVLELTGGTRAVVVERHDERAVIEVASQVSPARLLQTSGEIPLPPYIKRPPCADDRRWYQTVFAHAEGAIAAPTAGLHFTEELIDRLGAAGIGWATVTLHVGLGTFTPVSAEHIEDHTMQAEAYVVPERTVQSVSETKRRGGRVVAVGTTVIRTLESAANEEGTLDSTAGSTNLFITPGYRFRVVDALLTNFHLPRTTLLMLVAAFCGLDDLRRAYRAAVEERYRFYTYGDAMLIL